MEFLQSQSQKRSRNSPDSSQQTAKRININMDEQTMKKILKETLKEELNTTLDEKLRNLATKVDMTALNNRVIDLSQQVERTNNRMDFYERRERYMQLIFNNIINTGNHRAHMKTLLGEKFELNDVVISRIVPLRISSDKRSCSVLIEFGSDEYIPLIFSKINILKGTGISVDKVLSASERARKNTLLAVRRELLKRSTGVKIAVYDNQMKINNQKFIFNLQANDYVDMNNVSLRNYINENFSIIVNENYEVNQ